MTGNASHRAQRQSPCSLTPLPAAAFIPYERVGFVDLVAIARAPAPDPIPNSAVKPLSANGTVAQATGE